VQDARSAFDSANQQRELAQKQFTSGTTSRETVLTFERTMEEARLRLERANTLLDIYLKADPKNTVPTDPKPITPEASRPT
ncbi:TolC family protein, partial [Salmonella enterica]|uniref:TolC family protein n=1 Tax=Salmonella enterica TaxID=28901 RepID=UPI0039E9F074